MRRIEATGDPMFLVKLDYGNGLHKEYAYNDMGVANQAFETCCAAQEMKKRAKIFDEAGRQASVDGTHLQSVEFVDPQAETVMPIRLVTEVREIERQFAPPPPPQSPPPPPRQPVRDEEPEWRPAIGARG